MGISEAITQAESSGDPKASNPHSSALGLGQFVNRTWLDMIRRYRPDLAQGKSDAEILELRKNPDYSRQMTKRYAEENEAKLRQAGLPVTPGSTYLMHFAGPTGAVKLMQADPDTPVESILSADAIKANPHLQDKTASWVIDWANRKMGAAAASKLKVWSGQPIPDLAQTQDAEPAFSATGATSWPPHYRPPNVLSPEAARRLSSPPYAGPLPYVDETGKAQLALDNWLPPPDGAPRGFSDRFGGWDNRSGVSTPATSATYAGLRTGDHADLGAGDPRFAQSDAGSFNSMQPIPSLPSGGVAGLRAASYNVPMSHDVPFSNSPGSLATPSQDAIAAMPSSPGGQLLFHAMLAARRDRGPKDWTMPLPYYSPMAPKQPAFDSGLPGMLTRAGAFDLPAGGLLARLQELERNHPDDEAR